MIKQDIVMNSLKAVITWDTREPPTHCAVKVDGAGRNGDIVKAPATVFKLRFENKWYRIKTTKYDAVRWPHYYCVDIGGNRYGVTLPPADRSTEVVRG